MIVNNGRKTQQLLDGFTKSGYEKPSYSTVWHVTILIRLWYGITWRVQHKVAGHRQLGEFWWFGTRQ